MPALPRVPESAAPDPKHIADFARLEPWLLRGDQPDGAGYQWLAAHGVRVVVNLRLRNKDKKVAKSGTKLESAHIPVKNDRAPSTQQALAWLALCRENAPRRPIFVHCRGGRGRTSTFCALVRIAQGWTLEKAIEEERAFGFAPDGEHKRQARFLYDFFERSRGGLLELPKLP